MPVVVQVRVALDCVSGTRADNRQAQQCCDEEHGEDATGVLVERLHGVSVFIAAVICRLFQR